MVLLLLQLVCTLARLCVVSLQSLHFVQQLTVLCLDGVDLCQVVFTARDQFRELLVCLADSAG